MTRELQTIVDDAGTVSRNHFCVVVADEREATRKPGSIYRLAYVHWRGHYVFAYAPTEAAQIDATTNVAPRPSTWRPRCTRRGRT